MKLLINIMIFAGSALMIYNIIRYGMFVKSSRDLEHSGGAGLIVPLLLLIFFLIGYVAVAISGIANLLMAAILLGGSIFVFLLLTVMYNIIDHIRDTDQLLSTRYEEMRQELQSIGADTAAAYLVNLTRDEVEDRAGAIPYQDDKGLLSYTELIRTMGERVVDPNTAGPQLARLSRETLLARFAEGQTEASEVLLVREPDGEPLFLHIEVKLTKMPVSGDVIAFLAGRPYNVNMARRTIVDKVMLTEYDRIAYLVDGNYHVLSSLAGKKAGLLIPDDEEDSYESIYYNYILPAMPKAREAQAGPNPLRLSVIDKAMADSDVYEVSAAFVIDGETHYKDLLFYCVDRSAKFYLMLISDSTGVQEEQIAQNRRLSEALDEAVRSNEARIRFFTNMSHDLRTPMNGILGFTQLAMGESDPEKVRDYLKKVDFSGRRLMRLMDDLFAMSQIQSGTLQLHDEVTDLPALVEEIRTRFEVGRGEKMLYFSSENSDLRAPAVYCDGQRLRQLLSRLMENACTFAPHDGHVRLSVIQTESDDPARGVYEFHIQNDGDQIPPHMIDRVFEMDAWAMSPRNEDLPGVGLGMAVAKAFVDLMGGTVFARTRDDGDTEFTIRLSFPPARTETETPAERAAEDLHLHILLVDDNEINREIAELMLTAEGWTVEQAADGAEALERVRAAKAATFDLILMDVQMPVMNGYEATAAIRALPDAAKAAIPIIAVTANAYQEDANEALAAGMDGYVTKPIDPAVIRSMAARVLAEKQAASPEEVTQDE